jgi:hypothetical protein
MMNFIFTDDMFDELMRITDELHAVDDGADEATLQYEITRTADALREFLDKSVTEYAETVDQYIAETEKRRHTTDLTKLF